MYSPHQRLSDAWARYHHILRPEAQDALPPLIYVRKGVNRKRLSIPELVVLLGQKLRVTTPSGVHTCTLRSNTLQSVVARPPLFSPMGRLCVMDNATLVILFDGSERRRSVPSTITELDLR